MKLAAFQPRNSGFTIIEVLMMVVIVIILAAIITPRLLDVENKMKQVKVRQNMRIVQLAAEAYASSNSGQYPIKADAPVFKAFFPGGNCNIDDPQGGNYPVNPYTHVAEAPLSGNIIDVKHVRFSPPLDLGGPSMAGKIFYNAIITPENGGTTGYAIIGAGKDGRALPGPSPQLTIVLSNLLTSSSN